MQDTSNAVVRAAGRTASVIAAVKVTLLVINGLVAVILIATGIMAKPRGTATVFEGQEFVQPDAGTPLWWLFVLYGAVTLVVGSLLIFAILGWFEHMLRVNAEGVRLVWGQMQPTRIKAGPGSLGNVAGEIQTAPLNMPDPADR